MCYLPLLPYICIKQNYNEIQKSNDAEQISYVAAHGITGRVCTVLVGEVERPPVFASNFQNSWARLMSTLPKPAV